MAALNADMQRFAASLLPINRIEGEDVRWTVEERLSHYSCPGMAVCVIADGEIAQSAGFGMLTPGGAAVQADTIFAGASISKPLTAVLALQLVEQGRISLDAPVNTYLRSWKIPENDFTKQRPVTLRHLLSHRAGTTVHGFGAYPRHKPVPTLLDILDGRPPSPTPRVEVDRLPGEAARYSGGGTQIVQLIIEEAYGSDYASVAQEKIFAPLAMHRSTFAQPLPAVLEPLAAQGHHADGRVVDGRFTFTPQLAAGGVYTSAPDYARFMIECRNAWAGRSNRLLLGQPLAREMMTNQGGGQFALGWEVFGSGASARFGHGGSNEGYQCNSSCNLEQGWGGVVLTNGLGGLMLYHEVLNGMAATFGWDGYLRQPRRVRPIEGEETRRYAGRYRIVSGVDAPYIDISVRDGRLTSHIEGMILPPGPIYMDENGRFFSQQMPGETEVRYDAAGQAVTLIAYADGEIELLRAERVGDM
ncbi:beta-lactamase family protein [Sandaracinobacter neustonicus]|uniref:Beta-lactamase family protein n=1 Tax=Sandaracinobacter neustonicus TaxID=1715348 RepID=A0A501XK87_9SPHN|nr:serine hydrolase domain-containing protein [Sandaracinobacter neustonicus]TPE60990.1 beta-lactamase family protein [Sandaracinobacter neustonicus]